MGKRIINNRGDRRDLNKRKYKRNLKRNLYWLWIDKFERPPRNFQEADKYSRFAKQFRTGGNHDSWLHIADKIEAHKDVKKVRNWKNNKNINKEIKEELHYLEDPYEDNKYCYVCDNYPYGNSKYKWHDCPYKEKVNAQSEWKKIGCNFFSTD